MSKILIGAAGGLRFLSQSVSDSIPGFLIKRLNHLKKAVSGLCVLAPPIRIVSQEKRRMIHGELLPILH
jgi:hypothetical protein